MTSTQVSEEDNPLLLPITNLLEKIIPFGDETEFEEEFPNVSNLIITNTTNPDSGFRAAQCFVEN